MNKMDMPIMVVERDKLLGETNYFEGFLSSHEHDYEKSILDNFKYMRRGDAEVDPSHKQPIAYCIIANKNTGKVFAYQRAVKDEDYTEKRLQGKWSWGVGGHIDEIDNEGDGNPIYQSMLRELEEEIHIEGEPTISTLGYINYDNDDVSKVHFGILYLVETDSDNVEPKDSEMQSGSFKSLEELEAICNNEEYEVESWSKIALEALKNHSK